MSILTLKRPFHIKMFITVNMCMNKSILIALLQQTIQRPSSILMPNPPTFNMFRFLLTWHTRVSSTRQLSIFGHTSSRSSLFLVWSCPELSSSEKYLTSFCLPPCFTNWDISLKSTVLSEAFPTQKSLMFPWVSGGKIII